MKLFNMSSPKFDEQGETNMQSIETAHGLYSAMASGSGDRRLYKKKMMATKVTVEINLVYPWSTLLCTRCKYLRESVPLCTSKVRLIGKSLL
jgi:hypothetical protein